MELNRALFGGEVRNIADHALEPLSLELIALVTSPLVEDGLELLVHRDWLGELDSEVLLRELTSLRMYAISLATRQVLPPEQYQRFAAQLGASYREHVTPVGKYAGTPAELDERLAAYGASNPDHADHAAFVAIRFARFCGDPANQHLTAYGYRHLVRTFHAAVAHIDARASRP